MTEHIQPRERFPGESPATLNATARELRARARKFAAQTLEPQPAPTAFRDDQRAAAGAKQLRAALRGSVQGYATVLRHLGEPAERAVILVKELADEAARDIGADAYTLRPDFKPLRDQLVRWTIEAYYTTAS
jgi:hypothetical protein